MAYILLLLQVIIFAVFVFLIKHSIVCRYYILVYMYQSYLLYLPINLLIVFTRCVFTY